MAYGELQLELAISFAKGGPKKNVPSIPFNDPEPCIQQFLEGPWGRFFRWLMNPDESSLRSREVGHRISNFEDLRLAPLLGQGLTHSIQEGLLFLLLLLLLLGAGFERSRVCGRMSSCGRSFCVWHRCKGKVWDRRLELGRQ